jgi:hypothetical protein
MFSLCTSRGEELGALELLRNTNDDITRYLCNKPVFSHVKLAPASFFLKIDVTSTHSNWNWNWSKKTGLARMSCMDVKYMMPDGKPTICALPTMTEIGCAGRRGYAKNRRDV